MVRNWKMVLGGACVGLMMVGCTATLSTEDRAKLDEAIAASAAAAKAAQSAEMSANAATAAAQKAEAAAATAQANAQASKKAFEAGLKK